MIPPMPRWCQHGGPIPCPRRAQRWLLTGELGHSQFYAVCKWHFHLYDFMTRRWRSSDPTAHDLAVLRTDVPTLSGALHPAKSLIYVTRAFGEEDAVRQLFVLSHESLHLVLRRYFGSATALELDILYKRSLRCLGGHSMMTYELAALAANPDDKPLSTLVVL